MNLSEYKTFKIDAEKYLKKSIDTFKLKSSMGFKESENMPNDCCLFYENEHCLICLNIVDSFPHQDVTPKFYLKNVNQYVEIVQNYLRPP